MPTDKKGKKYPYTKEGKKAAKKANKKITMENRANTRPY